MGDSSNGKLNKKSHFRRFLEKICISFISREKTFAKSVLDSLVSAGVFDKSGIITNLFKFNDCDVRGIMIHRKDIVALDILATKDEMINLFSLNKHTRVPVYSGSIDNIIGFVSIKDVIGIVNSDEFSIKNIIREIVFVPPLMKGVDLLVKMKSARVNVAVIVDEYGITEGLVTISAIIDKIVGDTQDTENDKSLNGVSFVADGKFEISGRTLIKDLEEASSVKLFEVDDMYTRFSTVSGLILSMFGRVPLCNETVTHESGVIFTIIESDDRCVHKVLVDISHVSLD